jgi:methylthioribose-1-phosphate isomerase
VREHRARELLGFFARLNEVADYLSTSRPTAVNLFWAIGRIRRAARDAGRDTCNVSPSDAIEIIKQRILAECLAMIDEDRSVCRAIGENGLELLRTIRDSPMHILTHCNAGALAAVGCGTALAPIYVGAERGMAFHVWADETRPLLQGSRITAYELKAGGIPVTVICDSMAATVMQQGWVHAVIVGADRVAANGDVANKIGTLSVAILARHFAIPFYVAAPTSTIDLSMPDGRYIPIEQRDAKEVSHGLGRQTAPEGVEIWNPAFDVTPAELVTAIVTEKAVLRPPYGLALARGKDGGG